MNTNLNEIAIIRTGYNLRSIANTNVQTVLKISAKDLDSNFTDLDEIIIPSSYDNYVIDGDILVKSRGDDFSAKVFKAPRQEYNYVALATLIVVRVTDKRFKPSYLAQIINSKSAQQYLNAVSSGQIVPNLSPSLLGQLKCKECPFEKQEQLERILNDIDDYQVFLTEYIKAEEKLTKALKTKLMKGVI